MEDILHPSDPQSNVILWGIRYMSWCKTSSIQGINLSLLVDRALGFLSQGFTVVGFQCST